MATIEIKNDVMKGTSNVLLNGTDISNCLTEVDLKIKAGQLPEVNLQVAPFSALTLMLNNLSLRYSPEMIRFAAEIIRSEFMQKGDWYNALMASILGYLQETDGSVPYDQMAVELANRIVGIESDMDSIDNLDLSVRTYNCLKRAGINTVSQLRNTYSRDLLKIKNFTQKSLDELAEKLEKHELLERDSS